MLNGVNHKKHRSSAAYKGTREGGLGEIRPPYRRRLFCRESGRSVLTNDNSGFWRIRSFMTIKLQIIEKGMKYDFFCNLFTIICSTLFLFLFLFFIIIMSLVICEEFWFNYLCTCDLYGRVHSYSDMGEYIMRGG